MYNISTSPPYYSMDRIRASRRVDFDIVDAHENRLFYFCNYWIPGVLKTIAFAKTRFRVFVSLLVKTLFRLVKNKTKKKRSESLTPYLNVYEDYYHCPAAVFYLKNRFETGNICCAPTTCIVVHVDLYSARNLFFVYLIERCLQYDLNNLVVSNRGDSGKQRDNVHYSRQIMITPYYDNEINRPAWRSLRVNLKTDGHRKRLFFVCLTVSRFPLSSKLRTDNCGLPM